MACTAHKTPLLRTVAVSIVNATHNLCKLAAENTFRRTLLYKMMLRKGPILSVI